MAGDDVTITIRADNGDVIRAFRDVNGHLRDMRGRFVSEGSVMSRSMNQLTASIRGARSALIPLATAAVPLAAALGPVAVKSAAAGAAVAAFGIAVAGQVSHLSEASKAQEKYTDAVAQYGRGSKQAAEAQRQVAATLAGMPQATQRAAVGLQTLKGTFREWSDSTAKFTMAPVEKSFTVLGQMLPKLTPMVKGTSTQLDRLVSVAGGAVATPGFDALADKFSTFANDALKDAVDGIIHFSRALSEGEASGPIKAFMDYADQNGPAVRETLATLGDAVTTLATAAADAGPGMLTLVNAAASLVAALPPELVTVLMQTAVALKLVTLAGAGAAAVSTGIAALGTRIGALQGAAVAAGGGLAGLRAAFLALGTAAKASIVVGAIAAVVVAFGKLGDIGRETPPNIDKLTTSLGQLGRTGKVSGEAARLFGKDLDGLFDSVRNITDPSTADQIQNGLVKVFSLGFADSTPWQEARKKLDGVDEGLTNLVKGGKADVAAAAFKRLSNEYVAGGGKLSDFTGQMDGYKSALADVKFEQDLIADSMGIFGQAAQDTSAKLDAQKQSADGLRASILALNEVNRSAYDAQIGFEESLDGLTESFKKHGDTLNLDTEAGRANATAMSDAAKAQDELIATGLAAGESLGSMTKKSNELRETMMRLATEAFDGNKAKATDYVNTLLGAPGEIKTLVKLEREEAIAGLESVREAIRATPDSKEVKVATLNGAAIAALEAVGLKTKQLPDGKTAVYTANGQSLGNISSVSTALDNLNGKTATTYVVTNYTQQRNKGYSGNSATGGKAFGGLVKGYADGGDIQHFPNGGYIQGPGGPRSDSILATFASGATAAVSNTEFVVQASAVKKYGVSFLDALNSGRLKIERLAKGGSVRSLARGARDEIRAATSGTTEHNLLKLMDTISKGHLKMASALKQVTSALDKAKDKLSDLKSAASQLSSSVKSGVLSATNITRGTSGDGPVTLASIRTGLVQGRDKATAFADALKRLRSRGLSKDLLRQIAEAGIEGGGLETAGALLRASSSELKSINSLQGQISTAAGSAGKTTADALFGAQIKSQDKLVKALDRLADALKPKKKAAGGIVGAGLTVVGEDGPEIARLPQGSMVYPSGQSKQMAWASMLNAPRSAMRGSGSRVNGGMVQPIIVHQTITLDGRVVAQQVFEPLRREVRNRGGLEEAFRTTR
ncbi:phage tail protein [Streptomyces sp. MB09-02B]|uniref:phage tail protein n=1 Tax=Streptomyces sp. MB09-02B TaxID=3028667 RepID=UPI0029B8F759|nr:phage tail protein [Streptomyces sp. MB09-02B]MDX3643094.1 phage tail protein [Streptomyces sp. MB09-02B]